MHGYAPDKGALVKRLHRIEDHVAGLERMVEDGARSGLGADRGHGENDLDGVDNDLEKASATICDPGWQDDGG